MMSDFLIFLGLRSPIHIASRAHLSLLYTLYACIQWLIAHRLFARLRLSSVTVIVDVKGVLLAVHALLLIPNT